MRKCWIQAFFPLLKKKKKKSLFIPPQNKCFWGKMYWNHSVFLSVFVQPCLCVSVCVQNTSFCQSAGGSINPFPNYKILGSSKLKAFVDNNFELDENGRKFSNGVKIVISNFSFSPSVFKRLVLQTLKNQGLFGKGLSHI